MIIRSLLFLVLGYGSIFYTTYGVGDNTIFNSLISVFSAIVGGGLTLGGVAWTIKHEKEEKKLEEKLKAKPVVFICDFNNLNHTLEKPLQKYMISNNNYGTLKRADEKHVSYSIPQIIISNSDYSCVSVRGFRINNGYHIYDYGQVLSKNALIEMVGTYSFRYDNTIEYVSLILQDMLNNVYELEVNFEIYGNDKNKGIKILSGIEIKESDLVF